MNDDGGKPVLKICFLRTSIFTAMGMIKILSDITIHVKATEERKMSKKIIPIR